MARELRRRTVGAVARVFGEYVKGESEETFPHQSIMESAGERAKSKVDALHFV